MKNIVSLLIVLLAVFQTVTNIAYSAEDPGRDYKITQAYDLQGRIIKYGFDDLGRKTSTLFPDGNKETIEYMEGGGYTLTKTGQDDQFVSRLEYDQQGLLVKAVDDQGIEAIYTPSEDPVVAAQSQIEERLGEVELPTIIVEAPYLYPNLPLSKILLIKLIT